MTETATTTATVTNTTYAPLSDFRSPTPHIYYGERLKALEQLTESIQEYGLLNPLVVTKTDKFMVVIDGRKRLAAMRRLQFKGLLPASLQNIPFVTLDSAETHPKFDNENAMTMLSNEQQYTLVKTLKRNGLTSNSIAKHLYCSLNYVRDLVRIDHVGLLIRQSFLKGLLSLSQARAFGTITSHKVQNALLIRIGAQLTDTEILAAINQGQTILNINANEALILPGQSGDVKALKSYVA